MFTCNHCLWAPVKLGIKQRTLFHKHNPLCEGAVGVLGGVLHVAWWIVFAVVFASGKGPSGNAQLTTYQNQYNAGTCTTDMPEGYNCGCEHDISPLILVFTCFYENFIELNGFTHNTCSTIAISSIITAHIHRWFQSSIYGKICCCHTSQGSSYACIANNQYVFRTTECFDKCGFNGWYERNSTKYWTVSVSIVISMLYCCTVNSLL